MVHTSKLKPLYTAFLHSIKLFGYRSRIQLDNSVLVAEQQNFATKIINAYIVCNLDNWPKIPFSNFKLKNFFFSVTNIIKNVIKVSGCIVAVE